MAMQQWGGPGFLAADWVPGQRFWAEGRACPFPAPNQPRPRRRNFRFKG